MDMIDFDDAEMLPHLRPTLSGEGDKLGQIRSRKGRGMRLVCIVHNINFITFPWFTFFSFLFLAWICQKFPSRKDIVLLAMGLILRIPSLGKKEKTNTK